MQENQVNILKILREKVPAQKSQAPKLKLSTFQVLQEMEIKSDVYDTPDSSMFTSIEVDRFIYLIGYLLKKSLRSVKCESCLNLLFSENNSNLMINLRENFEGALNIPSNHFINFYLKLGKVFQHLNLIRDEMNNIEMEIIFTEFVNKYISNPFSKCHNIQQKLVARFFSFRYFISRQTSETNKPCFGSLSMN